ncbi:hypothetical protein LB506_010256 [Fusarium annulatum]|nr:hypothetical protein LB506_010256 [Fusarium annulatum]
MAFAFLLALVYGCPLQATIQFLSQSLDSDLPLFLVTPASRITVNLSWSNVSYRGAGAGRQRFPAVGHLRPLALPAHRPVFFVRSFGFDDIGRHLQHTGHILRFD